MTREEKNKIVKRKKYLNIIAYSLFPVIIANIILLFFSDEKNINKFAINFMVLLCFMVLLFIIIMNFDFKITIYKRELRNKLLKQRAYRFYELLVNEQYQEAFIIFNLKNYITGYMNDICFGLIIGKLTNIEFPLANGEIFLANNVFKDTLEKI